MFEEFNCIKCFHKISQEMRLISPKTSAVNTCTWVDVVALVSYDVHGPLAYIYRSKVLLIGLGCPMIECV